MADSKTEICTRAAMKIGHDPILSFDTATLDDGTSAPLQVWCKENYDKMVESEQSKHRWNFCVQRATLALSATAPEYGYSNKHILPNDSLGLIEVNGWQIQRPEVNASTDDADYRVEGNFVYSNESTVQIKYIKNITDPNLFPRFFVDCLEMRLAWEMAIYIRNDEDMRNEMRDLYLDASAAARFSDATEDPVDIMQADTWLVSRDGF